MTREVENLSWDEIERLIKQTNLAIIPMGSIETHGTHAPVGFDNYIAEEIAERLSTRTDGLLLPTQKYSCCMLSYDITRWPGTISITPETMVNLYTEIGLELSRWGIRIIVFVNAHGPNSNILEMAAYRIWKETGTAVGVLEWWAAAPKEVQAVKGFGYATHADQVETSILLATKGAHLVDLRKAGVNPPNPEITPEEFEMYTSKIKFTHELDERWIGISGNYGDPTKASKEHGEKIIQKTVEQGLKLIKSLESNIKQKS